MPHFLVPFVALLISLKSAQGYSTGAPCQILQDPTQTPGHGGSRPASASGRYALELFNPVSALAPGFPPAKVTSGSTISAGNTYTIKLRSLTGDALIGFAFVATFAPSGGALTKLASYSSPSSCVQVQTCSSGNFVTHSTPLSSSRCGEVSFKWTAPSTSGMVEFKVTFLKSFTSYYSGSAVFAIA